MKEIKTLHLANTVEFNQAANIKQIVTTTVEEMIEQAQVDTPEPPSLVATSSSDSSGTR